MDKAAIIRGARMELARREFFSFCQVMAPDFYRAERQYLVELCGEMQDFYQSDDDILIVNEPPRHGKSRTASMLAQWVFGQNPHEKVMTGSYNETLSTTFSKAVRNGISTVKADPNVIVYSDIFPQVRIQRGDGAMNLWSLEGGYNSYLATSPTGTATGFGATLLIIDDLIKNAEEASNENVLEKHWEWFTNTMLSRLEEGGKIIIIMTRWATGDLAGRALEHFKAEKKRVRHLTMKALQDDDTMLCPDVLSRESYDMKVRAMGADIASANYQQIPINIQGRLYKSFKTYTDTPGDEQGRPLFEKIISYTDTADQGSDFLCSIVAGVYRGEGYVLDVLYTKDGMETTEPAAADMFVRNAVNLAEIESNSGGRGYARNVERLIWEKHKTRSVVVKWFHQSKNKIARILSNSNFVMEHIYYPVNWRDRWPEYYGAMTSYQKEGKNKNDDAPDATTGLAEMIDKKTGVSFKK
ncbi:terminase [Paenibacillus sp. FSL R7-0273]|uniref:phage terminase large subunit n=1 Tax=Paenibacillus sp. FSL R7-0273 TaxID=1536772 RepID=UPI0004F62981|nr:phage terminase large subunit [Paenibacillus sp. FSL R7-0273]AIQ45609.1 terminase [Paenibacillus sp. FSL R7-0273]OMF95126.1 terminase [Paenibacillus sp. FSL R7-0273]